MGKVKVQTPLAVLQDFETLWRAPRDPHIKIRKCAIISIGWLRLSPGQLLSVGSGEGQATDKKGLIYQVPRIIVHNQQGKKIVW